MVIRLAENTIELGGVATGKQKALLHAIAVGIINSSGGISNAVAVAAITGMSKVAVAVFDVTSVNALTEIAIMKINNHSGICPKPATVVPIISLRPLLTKPSANAIPPANSNRIPHGISTAVRHSKSGLP